MSAALLSLSLAGRVAAKPSGGVISTPAARAWAAAAGEELRLDGDVALDGPASAEDGPLAFRTAHLTIFPKARRASSEQRVTFSSPHSILAGRGFRADMETRRFQLLNEVTGHYDTPVSASHR